MTVTSASPQNTRLMRTLSVLRDVVSRPSGAIGLFLVVFHVVLALVSPWIVPYDYKAMNSAMMLTGPEATHWLGTDHLGRDVFTRVLLGGREALLVTGIATPIAVTWGGFVGILFGLIGGRIDEVLMRVVDAMDLENAGADCNFWHRHRSADPDAGVLLRHSGDPHRTCCNP